MRIHAGCWFVKENQLGPPDQRAGQVDCLLLAAGEASVRGSRAISKAQPLDQRRDGQRIGVQASDWRKSSIALIPDQEPALCGISPMRPASIREPAGRPALSPIPRMAE